MEEIKLDPEFKAKWCAALRSGEYKQGKHVLRNPEDNSYCCLGVAYKVAKGVNPPDHTLGGYIVGDIDTDGVPDMLIGTGADAGIHTPRYVLVKMNDDGKSFLEIADYIEQNL
jgi:hypothetical protein